MRRAVANVDLGAIERNASRLADSLANDAFLCAVVKADGYGHGMAPSARAALKGGAAVLAVATASEAVALRVEMPNARILVMGAMSREEMIDALGVDAEVSVWRNASRDLLGAVAADLGTVPRVHVKFDSGMGRLGLRDPGEFSALIDAVAADERMELVAAWTHFATADNDPDFMREQLEAFRAVAEPAKERHDGLILHAANSAATLRDPKTHFDMVRCGVAIYGMDPFGRDPAEHDLEPALELTSYVADLKRFEAGSSAGYGRTWKAQAETWVAPVPIGYGDGWRRGLSNRADALVGGKRRPIVGTVSMDNITVDLGPAPDVVAFDEVVLIGSRAGERILAEDLARVLGTINYEITTGLTQRVERDYRAAEVQSVSIETLATGAGRGAARIEDALRSSPGLAVAAQVCSTGWVVGGAVRDALMGREVVDVDLAVEPGTEETAARAIAKAAGGAPFPLSETFGTWRVVAPDYSWHLDLTRLRADTIEGDLMLRDFTANAVAVPLADPGSEPIDPTGGIADIEARVLRAASARAFADDPLRLMRAARLAGALGFDVEPGTLELAREVAGRAGEPAGERRLAELRLLVAAEDPLRGLHLLDSLGATAGVLPELDALRGVEQNPNHHLDVHGHTIEVLRQLLLVESDLELYAGVSADSVRALLVESLGDDFTRGDALRLAALLHDTGKPDTKGDRDGYITFIGHDTVGAEIVDASLGRLKASRALRRYVSGVTRHHLHLGFMVHERPLGRRRLFEYLRACGDVAPDVTLLTAADRMSARGSGAVAAPEMIEAHLELVREVLPDALEWQRNGGPPSLPLGGDELAREAGVDEGPGLGRLILEVQAALFAGEIAGRDEVVAHARQASA